MTDVNRRTLLTRTGAMGVTAAVWATPNVLSIKAWAATGTPFQTCDGSRRPVSELSDPAPIGDDRYRITITHDPVEPACPARFPGRYDTEFVLLAPSFAEIIGFGPDHVDIRLTRRPARVDLYAHVTLTCGDFECHDSYARRFYWIP